ncbi:MAG: primosomal protein N' [Phycisphaerales bacterium]
MDSLFGERGVTIGDRFVRVAVERAVDRPKGGSGRDSDDGLTYALAEHDEAPQPIDVGERVEVPLGRGDRRAAGVVVRVGGRELLDGLPVEKVKRVLRRTGVRLPQPLVELARWMADYYVAPLGMVLATMMPAAVKHAIGRVRRTLIEPTPDAAAQAAELRLPPSARAAWASIAAIPPGDWPIDPKALARRTGSKTLGPINRLLKLGLLRTVEREEIRSAPAAWQRTDVEQDAPPPDTITPTPAQRRVIDGVARALGAFSVHLLRGVTSSGKTEVYLRLIEAVLARGQTAIVLVPEISLTPQTAGRFVRRFGDRVAVLHSGLSASQRNRQWSLASGGHAPVVVGARSAVFAPISNLGLIVVDEEHDGGYKQDQVPRYHARDAAAKRGQIESCPVLLASATPSMESWWNAGGEGTGDRAHGTGGSDETARRPRFTLWELPDRVGGGRLPDVEVIDLVEERREAGRRAEADGGRRPSGGFPLLGTRLTRAIGETLDDGGQIILLLNRRGYARYVCCPDPACGWSLQCDHCDAAMVLHRVGGGGGKGPRLPAGELVRCHHCLAEQMVPRECPLCRKRPFTLGVGTQQLEEELTRRFATRLGARAERGATNALPAMARLDADTMKTARDYFDALGRFARGEVKLLLGTQMIAKGLDFPNVRLVGVVNADTALAIPDFRAAERTFQLVSQVAGRTGRGTAGGRVIVQTMNPREPAILLAARHDYRAFAAAELHVRRASALPPASRMARIVIRDPKHDAAQARAAVLTRTLEDAAKAHSVPARIMGPMPCPIARIAGQFRFAVEVLAPRASELHRLLSTLRLRGVLLSDTRTAVDVDPVMMM